ncbi:non-ribosomal peptide synthetase [Aquimarina intermedia]|uniref:Fengycin family lipopeptide synthetase D n=1 Tax=Aquimarina intermedia TaxID=350814 RepID=A0A5S5C6X0_9FLAO|nr:non-ribosomal peptide synthetase [Aquimarina intermedia]TYP74348.1 fengycin family lipopeptide synthetase D [Aquimarina intermedia]
MRELLAEIKAHNIKISVDDNQLVLKVPQDFSNPDIITKIKNNKQELIYFISSMVVQDQSDYIEIEKAQKKEYYKLSSAQKRMYFLYEFDKAATTYNMPQVSKLPSDVDVLKISEILKKLVVRHKSLRTQFHLIKGEVFQTIVDSENFNVEHFTAPPSEVAEIKRRFIRPFKLSEGFPFRAGIIRSNQTFFLLIDMHHIISDGVSHQILLSDFMSLLSDASLEPLALDYHDFAEWQYTNNYYNKISKQRGYWLQIFEEEARTLTLPYDFERPLVRSDSGGNIAFALSPHKTRMLKALVKQEEVTLYIILFAVYVVLLHKISNEEDIIVGTPVAGRTHPGLENIVGMFVDTLALRTYPNLNKSFKIFLAEVKKIFLDGFKNQSFPYEDLVEALKIERNPNRNPLFDIFFSFNQSLDSTNSFEKKSKEEQVGADIHYNVAKFDLCLNVVETAKEIQFDLEYSTVLFKESTCRRFIQYYEKIIDQVINNSAILLQDICVLTAKQKKTLLYEFNLPIKTYPVSGTIIDVIERQCIYSPNKIAVSCHNSTLTYLDLQQQLVNTAIFLHDSTEIKKGIVVGIYMSRSIEAVITLLAALKLGAIYVPLDIEWSEDRLNTIVTDANIQYILYANAANKIERLPCIKIDIRKKFLNKSEKGTNPKDLPTVFVEDDAYIIYTSGSTGLPKGILHQHKSILDYALTFKNYFSLKQNDVVIQQSKLSFDTSIEEIFPILITGGHLAIVPGNHFDIIKLDECIISNQATLLSTTPLVLNELNKNFEKYTSLRAVISGGDVLLPSYVTKIIEKVKIYNTYGPSETTVCATYHEVNSCEKASHIGKPIQNRTVYILNPHNRLVPLGVVGEICIGGNGLAKRYVNNKQLTQEKFIDNPFEENSYLYKTGDLGKWLGDGSIVFCGRSDNQIKIRGYRVELGEIEKVLSGHSEVSDVIVIAHGTGDSKQLSAYYLSETKIKAEVLRNYIAMRLPNYMVPLFYVHMSEFPMTLTGKVDRKEFPEPAIELDAECIAPSSKVEHQLVAIWSEILNLSNDLIGTDKNFFSLGGHSILAIRMLHLISEKIQVDIPLLDLFMAPTIRELAVKIERYSENKKLDDTDILLLYNAGKDKDNLFFIHDGTGEVQGYLDLVKKLKDYNCYALHYNSSDSLEPQPLNISEIASEYILKIMKIQTEGEYKIIGWSTGGLIAYEITRQMELVTDIFVQVIMIDTFYDNEQFDGIANQALEFTITSEVALAKYYLEKFDDTKTFSTITDVWNYCKTLSIKESKLEEIKTLIPEYLGDYLYARNNCTDEIFRAVNTIRSIDFAVNSFRLINSIRSPITYLKAGDSLTKFNTSLDLYIQTKIVDHSDHMSIMTPPYVCQVGDTIIKALTVAVNN